MSIRGHRAIHRPRIDDDNIAALMTVATLLTGCAVQRGQGPLGIRHAGSSPQEQGEYVLQVGDSIDVTFYYHPDNNQANLLVRPDGKVYLPLIGEVQAAGLTAPQVAEAIVKRSSTSLRDPKVAVNVRTLNPTRIFVGGEVFKPGFVNVHSGPDRRAGRSCKWAGGRIPPICRKSSCSRRSTKARTNTGPRRSTSARSWRLGDTKADIVLGPSDVLVFPKTGIAKANLWMQQYVINMIPIRISATPF